MKTTKVLPIHKQGSKYVVINYRPISILNYFSKLFGKVMYVRLFDYIDKRSILCPSQHGFQPGHSTLMSLLNIQDSISAAIDRNQYSLGIFIDIAFDTVNPEILLAKLENLGIRGVALSWFQSYLSSTCQLVLCNGVMSSIKFIRHGVPQGPILGHLLFLLFINDLPNASKLFNF